MSAMYAIRNFPLYALLLCSGFSCLTRGGEASTLLTCPSTRGLCIWNGETWEEWWEVNTPEQLVDFVVVESRVVVLLRGHMAPGRIIVLNARGNTLLVRHLATGRSLEAVVGEGPGGLLLLCNGTIGSAWCDSWLPEEPASTTLETFSVPGNCVFPRFLDNKFFCVEEWPEPVLRIGPSSSISGAFNRVPFRFDEASMLQDTHPLDGDRLIVEAAQKIFLMNADGQGLQISEGEVLWSDQAAPDLVIFSQCWIRADLTLSSCSIASVGSDAISKEIWRSSQFWPVRLAIVSDREFLVQLTADDKQALMILTREGEEWTSRVVWSAGDQTN